MANPYLIGALALLIVTSALAYVFYFTDVRLPPIGPQQRANDTGSTPEGSSTVVNASNRFALDLYSRLKDESQGKNVFFSPYSISTALAMTYEGARGQTADEMRSVFHFPQDDVVRRSSYAAVYNALNPATADYQLRTANALWIDNGFTISQDYKDAVQSFYGGEANGVDFRGNTEQARGTINDWVAGKTNDKIKDLFPSGSLDPLTRLVLTNAIYFKGDWATQFDKGQTTQQDFHVDAVTVVKVDMMKNTKESSKFNYTETEELQALEMAYKGGRLSMLVLLPKDGNLGALEDSLSSEKLDSLRAGMYQTGVDVYFPKFTFSSKYTLNDDLAGMGMTSAFIPDRADFSGIDGKQDLFVQTVVHQAYVSVDEQGTEAAAATGVGVGTMAIQVHPVFRADHPFIFMILDKGTGSILFLGRVVNPASQ